MQNFRARKTRNARVWQHKLGMAVFAMGLIVSLSMLIVLPNPQDDASAFDHSMHRFAGRGAIGIVLLVAGQVLQKPAGADVQARLARMVASDREKAAKPRALWPDWPSNRTWVNPTLSNRLPKPHTARRTLRHETSL